MAHPKAFSIAALACAAALPMLAQASVTLYGSLDSGLLSMSNYSAGTGYLPTTAQNGSAVKAKDGGLGASHWGLRGSEDLGGGLRANFQLQGNLNTTNGTTGGANSSSGTSFFNQLSVVGLSGSFGEIKLGRQFSPAAWAMQYTDARGLRYFGSALTAIVGMNSASRAWIGNNSNVAFGTIYDDNTIVYTTPTWNHLKLDFAYSFGESGGKANSQQSVTALYHNGGLKLSALYYNGYGNNLANATAIYAAALGNAGAGAAAARAAGFSETANTNRLYSVGALYTLGDYTIAGQYYAARNPDHVIVPGGSDSLDMWNIGAGWRPAPYLNLTTAYYHIKDNKNAGSKSTQFVLGLEYLLSKRTWAYVQGAYVSNNGANMALSPMYASPVAADKNVRAFMVGLRHSF
ncbi:porin [Comamonas guangdongensis]|uniref:Porin n=1 Tax=Comamonas guangdongensis TaxID=510515 RepID=A0ABV4A1L3_9BURK